MFGTRLRLIALAGCAALGLGSAAVAEVSVPITYLRQIVPQPPVLSNLDPVPDDLGIAGAELGREDNATTGRFLGHDYALSVVDVQVGGDLAGAARAALAESPFLLIDAPASDLLEIAALPEAEGAVLMNVAAPETALRGPDCRANVLHTLPSSAMRADALMQFLVTRRWTDLVLIEGEHPKDRAFAEALRRSAEKFGLRIRGEKVWAFDADMRRNAAQEVPVFTQDFRDHHVVLVADEIGDFGRYIPFNTWEPRPVAGSEGLTPVAWAPVVEQWGAAQLQNRFEESAGRSMRPVDYAAWAAVRALGEAVTRTNQAEAGPLRDFLMSEEFELAGFKGRPMSFRDWNGQLRQPVPVVHARALVALPPLEGFLHPTTELDTLGLDRAEAGCTAFAGP